MKKLVLLIAALAMLAACVSAQATVVGGFNGSWDGWTSIGSTIQGSAYGLTPAEGTGFALLDSTIGSPYVAPYTNFYAGIEKTLTQAGQLTFRMAYANSGDSETAFSALSLNNIFVVFTGNSNGWEQSQAYSVKAGDKVVFYSTQGYGDPPTGANWLAVDNVQINPVPEPSSLLAMGGGLVTLVGIRRRRA